MTTDRAAKLHSVFSLAATSLIVIAGSVAAGVETARLVEPSIRNRYFPWITGRSLGIASYLALCALVMLGTWMRHPWRLKLPIIHAEARLRAHGALAIATVLLVAGHLVALASDKYAGVGWKGALIPGMSKYREIPVAFGVGAFWAMMLLTLSAGLAGRRGTKHWQLLHRFAALTLASVWYHGVASGTDSWKLRLVYLVTGALSVLLVFSRVVASTPTVRVERFRHKQIDLDSLFADPVPGAERLDAAPALVSLHTEREFESIRSRTDLGVAQ